MVSYCIHLGQWRLCVSIVGIIWDYRLGYKSFIQVLVIFLVVYYHLPQCMFVDIACYNRLQLVCYTAKQAITLIWYIMNCKPISPRYLFKHIEGNSEHIIIIGEAIWKHTIPWVSSLCPNWFELLSSLSILGLLWGCCVGSTDSVFISLVSLWRSFVSYCSTS
jgi:hypothetical protein